MSATNYDVTAVISPRPHHHLDFSFRQPFSDTMTAIASMIRSLLGFSSCFHSPQSSMIAAMAQTQPPCAEVTNCREKVSFGRLDWKLLRTELILSKISGRAAGKTDTARMATLFSFLLITYWRPLTHWPQLQV